MSFLATPGLRAALILATVAIGIAGMGLTQSLARWASPQKNACARLETRALADAVAAGAALGRHERFSGVDKRLYTAIQQRYLKPEISQALLPIECPSVTKDPDRRDYLLDPWGRPIGFVSRATPMMRTSRRPSTVSDRTGVATAATKAPRTATTSCRRGSSCRELLRKTTTQVPI